jgi:Zn-dependent M16 (insulinase) family peptidase
VAITCGSDSQSENREALTNLINTLPTSNPRPKSLLTTVPGLPSQAFFSLPYAVNYSALTLKGVPYSHPDAAVLRVLANLIDQKRIHPEVREKGGAYGGGMGYSSLEGIISFSSYRDPSFARSLEVMKDAGRWCTEQTFDEVTLGEMKLSIFKDIDAPKDVKQEGMTEFIYGITDEMRQRYHLLLYVING